MNKAHCLNPDEIFLDGFSEPEYAPGIYQHPELKKLLARSLFFLSTLLLNILLPFISGHTELFNHSVNPPLSINAIKTFVSGFKNIWRLFSRKYSSCKLQPIGVPVN